MSGRSRRRLGTIASTFALVISATVAALLLLPALLGYQRYIIVSGSMEPKLPVGSVVYDEVVPVGDLHVGDIITFVPPPEYDVPDPVTHRIVEILPNQIDQSGNHQTVFRTKGDANEDVDPWLMVLDQPKQARVVHVVPYLGYVYAFLNLRWVQILLIGVPAIAIAVGLVILLWRAAGDAVREERQHEASQQPRTDEQQHEAGTRR